MSPLHALQRPLVAFPMHFQAPNYNVSVSPLHTRVLLLLHFFHNYLRQDCDYVTLPAIPALSYVTIASFQQSMPPTSPVFPVVYATLQSICHLPSKHCEINNYCSPAPAKFTMPADVYTNTQSRSVRRGVSLVSGTPIETGLLITVFVLI